MTDIDQKNRYRSANRHNRYKLSKNLLEYYKEIKRCANGYNMTLEEIDELYLKTMDLILQTSSLEGKTITSKPDPAKILLYQKSIN